MFESAAVTVLSALAALMLLLFAVNPAAEAAEAELKEKAPPRRPNIVMLFADDLGYGDLSSYGHPTIRTPHLDRLGREGMRFTSYYAAPACTPARAQLLTGRYASRVGLARVLLADNPNGLAASETTFATLLREQGYQTMMVGKWHLGHAKEEYWPTSHGFEHFVGLPYSHDIMKPWVQTDVPLRSYRDREVIEEYPDAAMLTTNQTNEAVAFIKEASQKEAPFLLYLAYNMPHLPVAAPEEAQDKARDDLYADTVEMIDDSVGAVRAALEESGAGENTLIFFTSDNGPWMEMPPRMVADGVKRWHHGTPGPFRGSKGSTWEGGIRVPAIAWWPGVIPAGRSSAEMASVLDMLPTFANLAGATVPTDRPIDGVDLTPLLLGETDTSPREELFYFQNDNLQAVRVGPWKFRHANDEPKQLFHLGRDIGERYNMIEEHPQIARELQERMEAFRRELQAAR